LLAVVFFVSCSGDDKEDSKTSETTFSIVIRYEVKDPGELATEDEAALVIMAHLTEQLKINPDLKKFGEPDYTDSYVLFPEMMGHTVLKLVFNKQFPKKVNAINWAHEVITLLDQYIENNKQAVRYAELKRLEIWVKEE